MRRMPLYTLMLRVWLMVTLVARMRLVGRMSLVLLRLVLLVSHDRIMLHRLAHSTGENHGRRLRLSLGLRRHLLPGRCSALPRHAAQPGMEVATRGPRRRIRDIAIHLRIVEVLRVEGALGRLLWRVGLLRLIGRCTVRCWRLFIRLRRVRRREGRVASETALRETEPVCVGPGRAQRRHGDDDWRLNAG